MHRNDLITILTHIKPLTDIACATSFGILVWRWVHSARKGEATENRRAELIAYILFLTTLLVSTDLYLLKQALEATKLTMNLGARIFLVNAAWGFCFRMFCQRLSELKKIDKQPNA